MVDRYIPRALEQALCRAVREFPAVVLTGTRPSGKTTGGISTDARYIFTQPY
jgi:hypothetical protein